MTIRLGPDPNRSFLQRQNALFPQRYGLGAAGETKQSASSGSGHVAGGAGDMAHDGSSGLVDAFYALFVGVGGLVFGLVTTILLFKLTRPETLSAVWILGYAAAFLASAYAGAVITYMARRVVLIGALVLGGAYAVYYLLLV